MGTPYDIPLGSGEGTYDFRMLPTDEFEAGGSSVTVAEAASGRALLVSYTWTHADDGPQEGTLVLGVPDEDGTVTAAWVDSWHQRDVVLLTGLGSGSGATVGYEYAPGWTWEISVQVHEGALQVVMRNGVPAGEDGPATLYDVLRGRWS
ncbi:hypothetical protein [Nocardioides sp. Soil805]|uniref:hypothetical protein n=1 Tax=Nocardioides sp. Soil805 TaxID=1736416 RepID=UPI000702839E|nr:hypothetical protein [Nocardioides sp. Soil805]KRF35990.1 hypothetical protein ASG94_00365 [Nocardioides sp. Soil805]